jgi:homogentisate 1,2-dioxygenase
MLIVPQYDLTKFVSISSVSVDHTDPSIYTVLTAKSRDPNTPLVDFLWFGPHWDVAMNTFRPPYFHRNAASEFLANIYSNQSPGGRSSGFKAGGGSYEAGHIAHGGFSEPYFTEMKKMKNEPRVALQGN